MSEMPEPPPSGVRPLRRATRRRMPTAWRRTPFLLLTLSLVLAAVGAWEAHRAIAGHEDVVDGVLRDYAAFAAWTYGQHAEEAFPLLSQATFGPVLWAVNSGAPLPHPDVLLNPDEPDSACACPPSLAGSFALRIPVSEDDRRVEVSGLGLDPVRHGDAVSEIRTAALARADSDRMRGIMAVEIDGIRHLVAVLTVAGPEEGRVDAIYAAQVDPQQLLALFEEIHRDEHLLPPTLTEKEGQEKLLRVAVTGPGGEAFFGDPPDPAEASGARTPVGPHFGDLEVAATVLPEAAGQLVIGGLPRSRAPFMLGVFGLAILLGIVAAGQLRKENELAMLRSDFVAGVSHELRTPLAQIRLFLETLRLGRFKTEDEREWSLATIDRETRRLSHLVENVLHLSRDQNGMAPLDADRLDLLDELREIQRFFSPLAAVRRAEVRVEAAPGIKVRMHKDSLHQAVLNLLDNALKYGPKGQVIRIRATVVDERVELAVEDEGPGVPPEDRERIWASFERGSRAGGREAGSGIGLSVVREIMARSGGAARVESAAGGGARFVLVIPREFSEPSVGGVALQRTPDGKRSRPKAQERTPTGTAG